MSFSIRHFNENGLSLVVLTDEKAATEVAILPGHGASLHAFRVRQSAEHSFNVIDNYRDLAELEKEISKSFKSPKLSPFPCRLAAGKYSFEGTDYQFGQISGDGTAIHGLLYNKHFTITEESADDAQAMLSLEYIYKSEDPGYPFIYSCRVRYVLRAGNMLEAETKVTNLSKGNLPIADGWHPYFQLGGRVDDWQLQFYAEAIVEFDDRLVPTGLLAQYDAFDTPRTIGDTFLDNCFALKPELENPACELYNPANGLRVSFFPGEGYPYLQIYTPPARRSIAIENLSAAPDAFNNKMGLMVLQPGHSQIFTVSYKVSIG